MDEVIDRDDVPQRTGPCPIHQWETWDGECDKCLIEAGRCRAAR